MRVQAGPPKWDSQLFGGSSPYCPRPSRKMNMSRSGLPAGAARAAWNAACWSEQWLGTRSTIIRRPSRVASAIMASKSASVPNRGSTSQ